MKTRLLIILFILVGLLGGWLSLFHNKYTVTLIPNNDGVITVGTPSHDGGIEKELTKTNQEKKVKLTKGNYVVVFSSDGKESKAERVEITKNIKIESPSLFYSNESLNKLLVKLKPEIREVLNSNKETKSYAVVAEALYDDGTWYAAKLSPKNQEDDTVVCILHFSNNRWSLAAPPNIIVYNKSFPDIPKNVISQAFNNLGN